MKKTFLELNQIDGVIGKLYRKTPELKDSKFGYAYNRFHDKNVKPTQKKLEEEASDLFVEHALEDKETKALLKDEKGNYKYSKEGQLKLNIDQRKLIEKYETMEIEVEPYISSYSPAMSDEDFELLEGLVVSRETPRETLIIDLHEEKPLESTKDTKQE